MNTSTRTRKILIAAFLVILSTSISAFSQNDSQQMNFEIKDEAVGDIKIGMSLYDILLAMPEVMIGTFDYERVNGDFDQIKVTSNSRLLMTFSVEDEENRVSFVTARDARFTLPNGVHVGMTIAEAEKLYGKVKAVTTAYDLESVEFTNQPESIGFFVIGMNDGEAGMYEPCAECDPREKHTTKYSAGAFITAIRIFGPSSD